MKKKKNSFLQKTFLFFNYIAIICLLLSYLATITDPAKNWYFTHFGLGYPFILLINILFILIWVIFRKWYFLLSLIIIIVGYQPLKRTFGFRLATKTSTINSTTIKLMTWNVHLFKKFGSELDSSTRTSVLKVIKDEQPDIIGIQEFFTRKKGVYDMKDSILNNLNTSHYYYTKSADNDFESIGVAMFSKYPIVSSGDLKINALNSGNKGIWVDVKKGNKIIRIFVVHLASISFDPEDYEFLKDVKEDINTGKDVASSKRIVRKLKDAFIRRSEQVKILKEEMAKCKTPYLLMGDFNDTPASYSLAQMTDGIKNGFTEKGSGLAITYNGDFPNFQIDYILSSPQFNFLTYNIIKKAYSDHYPIRCNVSLPD
ncbi:MAG: endonuclease/exonuclease/phosphatase family protein [Pelobium sp.]